MNEMTIELAEEILVECIGKENVRRIKCVCGNAFVGFYDPTVCPMCKKHFYIGDED